MLKRVDTPVTSTPRMLTPKDLRMVASISILLVAWYVGSNKVQGLRGADRNFSGQAGGPAPRQGEQEPS